MRKTIQVEEDVYNKLLKVKGRSFSNTINDFLDIHDFLNPLNIKKALIEYEQLMLISKDINFAMSNGDVFEFSSLLGEVSRVISTDNPLLMIFFSLRFQKPISNTISKTYVIYNKKLDKYKIGRTKKPIDIRIKEIPGINTVDTDVIAIISIDIENELHRFFVEKRFSGEWFDLSDNDLKVIHDINDIVTDSLENGEHYKVIFEKCKNALEKFADSLYLKRK